MSTAIKNLVHKLLTRDDVSRKIRKWHLLTDEELKLVWEKTFKARNSNQFYSYLNVPRRLKNIASKNKRELNPEEFGKNLANSFPFINELLKEFNNTNNNTTNTTNITKLVACGGSIFRNIHNISADNNPDIDLFFVNMTTEEANTNLIKALELLSKFYMGSTDDHYDNKIYIVRNQHVTTLYSSVSSLITDRTTVYKYQFIHRIYPDVDSILGGFDLGPCMVGYDGKRLLATELGAWSSFGRILIVDTKRRSTTFERRIIKYWTYCDVVFPGILSSYDIPKHLQKPSISITEITNKVDAIIKKYGYELEDGLFKNIRYYEISHTTLKSDLLKTFDSNGYSINEEFFDKLFEDQIAKNITQLNQLDMSEVRRYLIDLCKLHHYEYDEDESGINNPYSFHNIICLPKLDIGIKTSDAPSYTNNNIQHPRKAIFKSKITEEMTLRTKSEVNFMLEKVSDYEDNKIYPEFIGNVNGTLLRLNKFEGIAAIFTLNIKADKSIVYNNIINSFKTPSIGDFISDLDKRIKKLKKKSYNRDGNFKYNDFHDNYEWHCLNQGTELYRYHLTRIFAEDSENIYQIFKENKQSNIDNLIEPYVIKMRERMIKNAEIITQKLQSINWITENPGRQWTSSINPIVANPRDWYGEFYTSFRTGNLEQEKIIRLIYKRSPLMKLINKDILNIIIQKLTFGDPIL